jgi:HD-GYP domain-containing protein (c-di-GMP phosphodiesterase class II)
MAELWRNVGTQFDPQLLEHFVQMLENQSLEPELPPPAI